VRKVAVAVVTAPGIVVLGLPLPDCDTPEKKDFKYHSEKNLFSKSLLNNLRDIVVVVVSI